MKLKMGYKKSWWINLVISFFATILIWVLDVVDFLNYNFTRVDIAFLSLLIWILMNQWSFFYLKNKKDANLKQEVMGK